MLGPCDAQVCGTFKSCKSSFNRMKFQRNLDNIGVRSFILTVTRTPVFAVRGRVITSVAQLKPLAVRAAV